MKTILLAMMFITLAGCKGDFVVTKSTEIGQETGFEPCKTCGFCRKWDHGLNEYGYSNHCNCTGRQQVKHKILELYGYYTTKPDVRATRIKKEMVWRSSICQL